VLLDSKFWLFLETPDGGDGGDGGSVYFRSTGRLSSLYDLRRAHFYGNNGGHGLVGTYSISYLVGFN
jgi:GTPase involved in cell partitioning and DNA repair